MSLEYADLSDEMLLEVFFPHMNERVREIKKENTRFVHYTTAEAALSILNNREFWFRQPATMNDKHEIEHGLNCLKNSFNRDDRFQSLVDSIHEEISQEIIEGFNELLDRIRRDSYLISISEHHDSEDQLGRLSMWRAYGKEVGVAIVMNQASFFSESDSLKSYMYPVFYDSYREFDGKFQEIYKRLDKERKIFQKVDRESFKWLILNMFSSWTLTVKHPGFAEEKEWRVIHSPTIEASEYMTHSIECINGIPQEIFKVKLQNFPEVGIVNLEPNELINRIIIGPTEHPLVLFKSFVKTLERAGITNPESKVWVSDIPLRR